MKKAKKAAQAAKSDNTFNPQNGNAEELLKAGNRRVEELFRKFDQSDRPQVQTQLIKQLRTELAAQAALEEDVLHPEARLHGVDEQTLDRALVELDGIKVLLNDLMEHQPGAPYFAAKVKLLSEYVKHHVGEEEKSDGLFAKAREAGVDMNALGTRLQARRKELTEKTEVESLKPLQVRSLMMSGQQQETERMSTGGRYGRQGGSRYENDDEDMYRPRYGHSGRYAQRGSEQQRDYGSDYQSTRGQDQYENGDRYSQRGMRGYGYDDQQESQRRDQGQYGQSQHGRFEQDDYQRGYGQRSQGYGQDRGRYEQEGQYGQQGYGPRGQERDDRSSQQYGYGSPQRGGDYGRPQHRDYGDYGSNENRQFGRGGHRQSGYEDDYGYGQRRGQRDYQDDDFGSTRRFRGEQERGRRYD